MKNTIAIVLLTLLTATTLSSQVSYSGIISADDSSVVPYANVIVKSLPDSTFIKGVTSNEEGYFIVEAANNRQIYLEVSSLGYKTLVIPNIKDQSKYNIMLETSSNLLDAVTVQARKSLYELKNDRVVVNVGSIPSFGGDNALQVLQKSPGVVVDENAGSINLNNKGEVLIMINDRISRIPSSVLISQLRSIRAENIEKIELIHQPSAKYDADNAAGIIHIVLKSNDLAGFNGNLTLSTGYGQREKANASLGLNYRRNKLNVYGNASVYRNHTDAFQANHQRAYTYQNDYYSFTNKVVLADYINEGVNSTLGIDYNINNNTILGILVGYNMLNEKGQNFTSDSEFFVNNQATESTTNQFDIDNPKVGQFINVNLFKRLSNKRNFSVDIDRAQFQADNYGYFSSLSHSNQVESIRNSKFQIWTLKGDYQQEFTSNTNLEIGFKGTNGNTESTSLLREKIDQNFTEVNGFRRDDKIKEIILAGYSSVKHKFTKDWDGEIGLRYEQYNYTLDALSDQENLSIQLRNLFPIARLNYEIDSIRSINLSFNRRTNRPNYNNLVAYQLFLDPTLYVNSNVTLRPAFTNALRLSYRYKSILSSLEMNRTRNAISFYNTVDKEQGVQISTPINYDKMESVVANVSLPIYVTKWYEANVTLTSGYYRVFDSSNRPLPIDIDIWSHNLQVNNTFQFGRGFTANLGGRYLTPYISGDQFQDLGININLGISKKLGNGSIVFNIQDVTNTSGIIHWEYEQAELGIRTFGDNDFSERVFRLTYSTTFGDQKLKAKRNRETGSQEERNRM